MADINFSKFRFYTNNEDVAEKDVYLITDDAAQSKITALDIRVTALESGGGTGDEYLPITGGTLTGDLFVNPHNPEADTYYYARYNEGGVQFYHHNADNSTETTLGYVTNDAIRLYNPITRAADVNLHHGGLSFVHPDGSYSIYIQPNSYTNSVAQNIFSTISASQIQLRNNSNQVMIYNNPMGIVGDFANQGTFQFGMATLYFGISAGYSCRIDFNQGFSLVLPGASYYLQSNEFNFYNNTKKNGVQYVTEINGTHDAYGLYGMYDTTDDSSSMPVLRNFKVYDHNGTLLQASDYISVNSSSFNISPTRVSVNNNLYVSDDLIIKDNITLPTSGWTGSALKLTVVDNQLRALVPGPEAWENAGTFAMAAQSLNNLEGGIVFQYDKDDIANTSYGSRVYIGPYGLQGAEGKLDASSGEHDFVIPEIRGFRVYDHNGHILKSVSDKDTEWQNCLDMIGSNAGYPNTNVKVRIKNGIFYLTIDGANIKGSITDGASWIRLFGLATGTDGILNKIKDSETTFIGTVSGTYVASDDTIQDFTKPIYINKETGWIEMFVARSELADKTNIEIHEMYGSMSMPV